MNVLVLVGSLRADSTNRQLADAAIAHLPAGVDGTVFTRLAELPHYSEDLDHDDDLPQVARDLREAVADAEAVLLVTPEYNGSLPSAVKNAVDWVSRPRGAAAIAGKPAAVLGAALGFGAQKLVQDLLAGFFIITERQYGFGDLVQLNMIGANDAAEGTVEEVTLRVTKEALRRIRAAATPDGDDLVREAYGSEGFRRNVAAFLARSTR